MGRGLFFRIYTLFWLTAILSGVALEATAAYAHKRARVEWSALQVSVADAARAAADQMDGAGETGLAGYIFHLQRTQPVTAFFFDDRGYELTRRGALPATRNLGVLALREPGIHTGGDNGEFTAVRVVGSKGKAYAMVLVLRHTVVTWYWLMFPYFRLTAIVAISGVFCFLIARHVTRPLTRLQQAVAGIAEGRLDTRASTDFEGRGDEIAGLARDFNRMAARLEALINGHKQLMANVSHELRSPLSRLLVALSLVSQGPKEEVPEHLERIGTEARRLDKLIGQLLALSRLDSTVDGGERTAIDLATLVHEVSSDADFEGRASGRRVEVAADPGCVIRGNEEALRSALENILRNAVRHTADDTKVEVSLRREPTRTVIRVRDHGPGVPDNMLRNIFVPFRRVENSTDGSGLGLAIAERAVASHSGSILASNAESGGLVVEMELPAG